MGGDWTHASLNDSGHTIPAGASLDVGLVDTRASFNVATNPGVGVFIYRSTDGVGTFSKTGFSLVWKFAQDGVQTGDTVDIRVFAVEMVYIPAGHFFAGDNATSTASFKQGSGDNDPWWIGSEQAISVGSQAGTGTGLGESTSEYYYVTDNFGNDDATGTSFLLPSAFPKGYWAFYMMKGEISQGQWVAFFNTLTATQKSARDITAASGKNSDNLTYRNNVSWVSGDATLPDRGNGATYASVAMSYISWADLTAYLDWAGLRPMSELEYERAGRGPYRAVSGEYAWGSTTITEANTTTNSGQGTEVAQGAANCVYNNNANVQGPIRVGSMASTKSTRIEAGAGYYGNMDLAGSLYERAVTVGNSAGRSFDGAGHGNGILTAAGNGDVATWPNTGSSGTGLRGGTWDYSSVRARLSDREMAGMTNTFRAAQGGGRGVRTTNYFCGGDGTAGSPYRICDLDSLANMAHAPSASFIITNNIDASATTTSNNGGGWLPIGTSAAPFTGTLNGQDYVISGLKINRPTGDNVGLFGVASATSTIRNISFTGVSIVGKNYVGSTAGQSSGVIQNVAVQGSVQGIDQVGGIIGYLGTATGSMVNSNASIIAVSGTTHIGGLAGQIGASANITTSWSSGTVTGNYSGGSKIGGLVGRLSDATISRSYSSATVNGNTEVGGLVGKAYKSGAGYCTIEYSRASGSVTSRGATAVNAGFGDGAGGLVGVSGECLIIRKSYATGNVTSEHTSGAVLGGLVGQTNWGGQQSIEDSYATGSVTYAGSNGSLGGLAVYFNGSISRSYATGTVNGPSSTAAGLTRTAASVSNSFSTGVVTGQAGSNSAGLISAKNVLTNSYWLKPSGSPYSCFATNSNTGSAATCTDVTDSSFFSQAGGSLFSTWDFTTVWTFPAGGGLPILRE